MGARITQKELLFLSYLRQNARKNLTMISRKTGIPVSTLFDKLKRYEQTLIQKHTALVDFNKLGFHLKAYVIVKVKKEERDKLKQFLERHPTINNLYRITNGGDFLIEGIFRDIAQFQDFTDDLESFSLKAKQQYYVLEDIKRESFLADQHLLSILF